MLDVEQEVRRITSLHRRYTSDIEMTLSYAVSQAALRAGLKHTPAPAMNDLVAEANNQFESLIKVMVVETSSEAIISAMKDELDKLSAEEAEKLESLTEAYQTHLYTIVSSQTYNDAKQAAKRYHDMWLRVELAMYRRNVSIAQAIREERDRTLGAESFRLDRSGKVWKSSRYIEVETRRAITNLFNIITVYLLGKRGIEELKVFNPGNRHHDEVFAFEDYQEVEDRYFHPNSPALAVKVNY